MTIRNKINHFSNDSFLTSLRGCFAIVATSSLILLAGCGGDSTENVTNATQDGIQSISELDDLPDCAQSNDGELVFVKRESAMRVCSDGKWYATASTAIGCTTEALKDSSGIKILCGGDSVGIVHNWKNGLNGKDGENGKNAVSSQTIEKGANGSNGKDGSDGKDGKDGASCTAVALKDNSGLKVLCGGDSVGVVLNGTNGAPGIAGDEGPKGEKGDGCFMKKMDDATVRVYCGQDSTTLYTGMAPDISGSEEPIVLDSEKIAISLDEVSGVTQKGPFLSGSKVLVREMTDGRTLTQTGNSFNGKILNDKGEFKINARMLVSQYVMLEATGYYRNEVSGDNSNSELTLFAITNVNNRSVVNVNLLTHLEYERVVYLVTQKKLRVAEAKKLAQKEVFALLDIDATGFSNSEDLNIAGSSDEDGALLAFSILFQGDRQVASLSELLSKISTDMKEDGTWDNVSTKLAIAEWAADADSSGRLKTIRNNVKAWGLSNMVPNFEKYVHHFWTKEYGLGDCTADSAGIVKAAAAGKRKGTQTRYICRDGRWIIANDYEKDTYGWKAGEDGDVKVGAVTGTKYYLYDVVKKEWRDATLMEQVLGGCIESVESDKTKNTGLVNGAWYKCENRIWIKTSAFFVDTQEWVSGSDGDVDKGDNTDAYYVYDEAEGAWRTASAYDYTLGLYGCTTNRTGVMGQSKTDKKYYSCSSDHSWILVNDKVAYNTVDYDCDEEGKMVLGKVDKKTYFVCDGGLWREATTNEERIGEACTAAMQGFFNKTKTRVCDNNDFRDATIYDFEVGEKNYFNPYKEYSELKDIRDGRTYKTVTINGITVMAENLNYADEDEHSYLVDNNWCYNDDTTNCLKGGRYYTWTAAMDIDSKWQYAGVPEGTIQKPHQGICPDGWHIPTKEEWTALFSGEGYTAQQQAVGNVLWTEATNESGFSALPAGRYFGGREPFELVGWEAYFWSATESCYWSIDGSYMRYAGSNKSYGYSVRCFKD